MDYLVGTRNIWKIANRIDSYFHLLFYGAALVLQLSSFEGYFVEYNIFLWEHGYRVAMIGFWTIYLPFLWRALRLASITRRDKNYAVAVRVEMEALWGAIFGDFKWCFFRFVYIIVMK